MLRPDAELAVSAVLWDMDGLLVDSEPLWTIAETDVCNALGGEFTVAAKAEMVGHRLDSALPILLRHLSQQGVAATSVEALGDALLARMVELFAQDLPYLPGALTLLDACLERELPCALVSSSYRVLVDAVLNQLPGKYFLSTVAGDEVDFAKPHPQPYLRAAAELGVNPSECLVLEDSPTGVRSAIAAGCRAILVPSVPGVEIEAGWTVLESLAEVRL